MEPRDPLLHDRGRRAHRLLRRWARARRCVVCPGCLGRFASDGTCRAQTRLLSANLRAGSLLVRFDVRGGGLSDRDVDGLLARRVACATSRPSSTALGCERRSARWWRRLRRPRRDRVRGASPRPGEPPDPVRLIRAGRPTSSVAMAELKAIVLLARSELARVAAQLIATCVDARATPRCCAAARATHDAASATRRSARPSSWSMRTTSI